MLFIFSSPILMDQCMYFIVLCINNKCCIKQNKTNILYICYIFVTIHWIIFWLNIWFLEIIRHYIISGTINWYISDPMYLLHCSCTDLTNKRRTAMDKGEFKIGSLRVTFVSNIFYDIGHSKLFWELYYIRSLDLSSMISFCKIIVSFRIASLLNVRLSAAVCRNKIT